MSSIIDAGRVYQGLIGRAINTTLPRPIRVNRDRKSDAGPSSSWRKTSINTRFANVDVIDPLVNPTFVTTWNVSASPEGGLENRLSRQPVPPTFRSIVRIHQTLLVSSTDPAVDTSHDR